MNLSDLLNYERKIYSQYMFPTKYRFCMSRFKHESARMIWKWQSVSRKADYYYNKAGFVSKILYLYYVRWRNILGERYGLEISTENIGPGLLIYHYNNVVNSSAIIGKNCHIHGTVVIGNAGPQDLRCPIIGDNVMIGAGAKIIGNIKIADDIIIAAGAVVVTSFLEPGITIGGIPAKKIK